VANGVGEFDNKEQERLYAGSSRSLNLEFTCDYREPSGRKLYGKYLLVVWSILIVLSFPLCARDLPVGTTLEARLSTPTGSRISHTGDEVEARTIAPVGSRGQILVPQGSKLFGSVESVKRYGLGLKTYNSQHPLPVPHAPITKRRGNSDTH
jgi:hypothetical protein